MPVMFTCTILPAWHACAQSRLTQLWQSLSSSLQLTHRNVAFVHDRNVTNHVGAQAINDTQELRHKVCPSRSPAPNLPQTLWGERVKVKGGLGV